MAAADKATSYSMDLWKAYWVSHVVRTLMMLVIFYLTLCERYALHLLCETLACLCVGILPSAHVPACDMV